MKKLHNHRFPPHPIIPLKQLSHNPFATTYANIKEVESKRTANVTKLIIITAYLRHHPSISYLCTHTKDETMPIFLPKGLPAIKLLEEENITAYTYDDLPAGKTVDIALLNLMPTKVETERDIARALSHSSPNVKLWLVNIHGHTPKHTPAEHLSRFYIDSRKMQERRFDGLIITGAPVELIDFEDVTYWKELTRLFEWAKASVKSTIYICWAAQAGLYYNCSISKHKLDNKKFGIFPHRLTDTRHAITRGFDDVVWIPHSRHTTIDTDALRKCESLDITLESDDAGPYMIVGNGDKEIYVTGHIEYSPLTLDNEYKRDIAKGLDIAMPVNYYRDDNPANPPVVRWRAHAALMFSNWVKYYLL